jgi:23S rRNA (adenine2503-C2)-methyltransferase
MLEKVKNYLVEIGVKNFRIGQLEKAFYSNFVIYFKDLTNFNKVLREKLIERFGESFIDLSYVSHQESDDSVKFVLKTFDDNLIEVVLMKHLDGRRTVCVSSQIFCAMGCKFCATGQQPFKRNLSKSEILSQVLFVNDFLRKSEKSCVTNVVFMGMGEPFLNYKNVKDAIFSLNDKDFFNIGARHITVSTCGIVPKIYEFMNIGLQVRLAISLHAPNDDLRDEIMPINNKYPLKVLFEALDEFVDRNNKRVSYEYVLIDSVNDSEKCAIELANLLKNRLSFVNLLVYNPHAFSEYKKPNVLRVSSFKKKLESFGIKVAIRKSLGDEIDGACGQLAGKRD